ncbi:DUF1028 domain-containing protein [Devosia sp.]|uniref:DUF1028 domain-containing protein n=1 Tax=Devosia sp. TaxID=1871048 RepID=UPI00261DD2E9|nr:DUF1028 domain-containing protein [Devosia sp.]
MTFTIIARDGNSGDFGLCIATGSPAVGSIAPFGAPGAGILSYQSVVEPRLGKVALGLLEAGYSAEKVLSDMQQMDGNWEYRQVGIIDARGGKAVFSGKHNRHWAGHRVGSDYIAFGNLLSGEKTIDGICDAWESNRGASFDERLLLAIEGGRDAGGQPEGQTSAAIVSYGSKGMTRVNLRCDLATEPIAELRRIFDWFAPLVPYYEDLADNPTLPRHKEWLIERGIKREFGKPPQPRQSR